MAAWDALMENAAECALAYCIVLYNRVWAQSAVSRLDMGGEQRCSAHLLLIQVELTASYPLD